MSPASYRTAPPRVGEEKVTGARRGVQIRAGRHSQAREWVDRNDQANARLVAESGLLADRVVSVW